MQFLFSQLHISADCLTYNWCIGQLAACRAKIRPLWYALSCAGQCSTAIALVALTDLSHRFAHLCREPESQLRPRISRPCCLQQQQPGLCVCHPWQSQRSQHCCSRLCSSAAASLIIRSHAGTAAGPTGFCRTDAPRPAKSGASTTGCCRPSATSWRWHAWHLGYTSGVCTSKVQQ